MTHNSIICDNIPLIIEMKKDFTFIYIICILIITFVASYSLYNNITHIKEGFNNIIVERSLNVKEKAIVDQMPFIDAVIFINLDSRTDRKEEILSELKRLGIPEKKIHRLSAIKRSWGALGCALSHIACYNFIEENAWEKVLILEDDAGFEDLNKDNRWASGITDVKSLIETSSTKNIDSKWDVIFLGGIVRDPKGPIKTEYNTIYKTLNTSCMHAYIVRKDYVKTIREHVEISTQMLMKNAPNVNQYHIDNAVPQLMKDDRWFITIPTLAYQRESFSDIEGKNANTDEPLRGQTVRAWANNSLLKMT